MRRRETVVGRIARGPDGTVIVPYDTKIDALLRVPDGKDLDAPDGIYVDARITAWPDEHRLAQAEVIELIGFPGDAGHRRRGRGAQVGHPPRRSRRSRSRSRSAPSRAIQDGEWRTRRDLTRDCIVTIDGETARDFDDAISAEELPGGGFRLGIHIADVSHYVTPGSALDAEAFERGTSVYFPDRAVPMLPERLSNDLCSLRPREEKRTVTALLTLDAKGETVTAEFYRSVIHSKARLTYTDVAAFFQGDEPGEEKVPAEVRPMLLVARKAAFALRWMRRGRGSLDFDLPDADLVLGETGDVVAIVKAVRNEAHRLIEEFMLAANEAVARHLVFVPTPAMYRVHDKPDERKLGDLRAVLEPLGYDIPAGRRPRQPGGLPDDPRPGRGQARGALRLRPRPARPEEGPLRPRVPRPLRPRGDVLRPLHLAHPPLPRPRRPPGPLRVDRLAPASRRGRGRGPRALARRRLDPLLREGAARRVGRARGAVVEEVRLPLQAGGGGVRRLRLGRRPLRPLHHARRGLRRRPPPDGRPRGRLLPLRGRRAPPRRHLDGPRLPPRRPPPRQADPRRLRQAPPRLPPRGRLRPPAHLAPRRHRARARPAARRRRGPRATGADSRAGRPASRPAARPAGGAGNGEARTPAGPHAYSVALVGRPNVGKSALFNRLSGTRKALVHDRPGMTRDSFSLDLVSESGRRWRLVDTGGLDLDAVGGFAAWTSEKALDAVVDADLIVLVLDGADGVLPEDQRIGGRLRALGKPVVVAWNKIDRKEAEQGLEQGYELGFDDVFGVSAVHGIGTDELLEELEKRLPEDLDPETRVEGLPVAIVGRPNVGKSSIVNRIVGAERVMVSEIAGTTRNPVDVLLTRGGKSYVLVDTAGIRRKGKTTDSAELLSVVAARKAMERARVAIIIFDASEGITAQDAHIAGYAEEARRGLILVANKWDLLADDEDAQKALRDDVRRRFVFTRGAAFLTVSAKTGLGIDKLLPEADAVARRLALEVPDGRAEPRPEEGLRGAASEGQVRARAEDPLRRPGRLRASRSSASSPTATSPSTSPSSASSRTASARTGTSPASR